jgi:hypothetical protein
MNQVDRELMSIVGLSGADVPSFDYVAMFDRGVSAEEAANEVFDYLLDWMIK